MQPNFGTHVEHKDNGIKCPPAIDRSSYQECSATFTTVVAIFLAQLNVKVLQLLNITYVDWLHSMPVFN